ncbi:MAG: lytic transglycosylase domain-containing protein [Burkholderiales bacterium]|jgi:soluble lytic murein transglycosylase|nr:lytic transglycosylase domain-containing protein [Burkholderiales bacterium]
MIDPWFSPLHRILICVLLMGAGAAGAANLDDAFLKARDAARTGDSKQLEQLATKFQGHVLEPYVQYWRLRARLEAREAEEMRSWLAANRDTPLSDYLRRDWLKLLGKNGQWELFNAELPALVNDDPEMTCYGLQARVLTDTLALREARPLWFVARDLPGSCDPLFQALVEARQLSVEDIWIRIRLALEAGQVSLANRVAAYLPKGQAPDPRALSAISSNPASQLAETRLDFKSRANRETTMFAVYRLARTSPQQAAAHWVKLAQRFTEEERSYVWGMLGYFGAMRHDPAALDWFAQSSGMSDLQLGWKVRAALRAKRWPEVLAAIEAMTPKEAEDPAWRYWKARALKTQGRTTEATALLKPLSAEYHFYGQLALEDLGGSVQAPATAYKPTDEEIRSVAARPGIKRALELFRLDLRLEAVREWLWAIRGLSDRQLLAAAEVARRNAVYDRAINTADRTLFEHDFGLRYLAPYRDQLKAAARQLDLDEAWVNGLIRQESRFIAQAKSRVGASGLMQLMPATAKWVAGKIGLKDWQWSQVTDVETNLSLGTYYLRHVLDTLDGSPVLASAAYNAGPGRARAWRDSQGMEAAIYAESIPFNETRDYVKRVMANASYYASNFSQQSQSLKSRIGVIEPRVRDREKSLGDTP